uniref:Uncharacterized protein n=1 Tax=Cucumis sativus TaxID=3659 RepID=A0A0A0KY48_CUCSA
MSVNANIHDSLVKEEAAEELWNLSVGEEYKGVIVEACGVTALVDFIFKWSSSEDGVVEGVIIGGVHVLVMLARTTSNLKEQGQVATLFQ